MSYIFDLLQPTITRIFLSVQGYSSFIPVFSPVTFLSLYLQLPFMLLLFIVWKLLHRQKLPDLRSIDLKSEEHVEGILDLQDDETREAREAGKWRWAWKIWYLIA